MATWAIMITTGMQVRNILTVPVFCMCIFLFRYTKRYVQRQSIVYEKEQCKNNRAIRYEGSLLFSLLFILAEHEKYTESFTSPLFGFLTLFAAGTGLFILFRYILELFDAALSDKRVRRQIFRSAQQITGTKQVKRNFVMVMLVCLLCWLPYFLYEYPGIMSPDSINQFEQVVGMKPWSNHHPVAHTLCLDLFYHIGRLFTTDITAAISCYTIAQMLFMAFCIAVLIHTLEQYGVRKRIRIPVLAFYALLPFQGVFMAAVWKDIPFSGIFMLFLCTLLKMIRPLGKLTGFRRLLLWVQFCILGCAVCLFRSNGWYCFLLLIPFLVYGFRRQLRWILVSCAFVVLTAGLIRGPVMQMYGIAQPDFIESCSVPLQQIARVVVDSKDLTPEQEVLIHKVIDTTYIKQLYAADFADNMKELVRAGDEAYLTAHKAAYAKLWLQLGTRYPGTYLEAWAELTKGFWFPNVTYETGNIDGVIQNDVGVTATPLIGGTAVIKGKEILLKLGDFVPLYGLLFSMGTYSWLLVCAILRVLGRRSEREKILVLMPCVCLLLTLLIATPTATEFRYAYPIVLTMPLWMLVIL